MNANKATLLGIIAIILWSSVVGLIRSVSESFGALAGIALIYTIASVFLFASFGFPKLSKFPKPYLIWGTLLFVVYEICFTLSIGFAKTPRQAIEVGMVNYLWPSFTIVATMLFTQQKANFWLTPGLLLAFSGIVWILGGEQGINPSEIWQNIQSSTLSYFMAFIGAIIWAAYCVLTAKTAKGSNGITLYFMLVAVVLWIQYLLMDNSSIPFTLPSTIHLVLAASALGFGYALWNFGILYGNMTLLAITSYFIPVFSALIAATILKTPLSFHFWQGVLMVSFGSVLCWLSTRKKKATQ